MGKLDEVTQRIEGKADEVIGEFQQQSGQGVKGGLRKMKGKAKQATAPLKDIDGPNPDDRRDW